MPGCWCSTTSGTWPSWRIRLPRPVPRWVSSRTRGALTRRRRRVWDAEHVLDDREYGAVTTRPRDHRHDPDYYDDEERYAHEYEPGEGRFKRGVRGFVHRYGWRAYALPVLVIVTVVALVSATSPTHKSASPSSPAAGPPSTPGHASAPSGPATGSGTTELKSDQAGANSQNEALSSDALPNGGSYTVRGTGTFRTLPGTTPVVGSGPLHTYTIDVENGIT